MDVREVGDSGRRTPADDERRDDDENNAGDDDDDGDRVVPEAWRSKPFRLCVMAAVVILTAGIGFGIGKLTGAGNNVVRSDIPKPETTADPFIEGSGSIAEDNLDNIHDTTAPGMVHILSGGQPVGIGLVLTQSGKVLTTYRPAKGATNLTAKYVLSGATFKTTVIGTDPTAGLALLQMAGSPGWPFVTVQVGNDNNLVRNAEISSETSYHVPGQVADTAVGTSGTGTGITTDTGILTSMNTTVDVSGGGTRSGLMASAMQADVPSAIGGPLVDLNGKVIGITIGGSGSGLDITAYAIPINTALADAQQIANDNRSLAPSDSGYRLGGRLRTVFGRLVARRGPVRLAGLAAWWLPGAWWGVGFPWCGLGVGGFPGSRPGWPHCVRWGGAVPCRATPGPVAESASPQHQRRSVVPGER